MTFLHSLGLMAALYPVFLAPVAYACRKGWLPNLNSED
jgi:hypothetical protein